MKLRKITIFWEQEKENSIDQNSTREPAINDSMRIEQQPLSASHSQLSFSVLLLDIRFWGRRECFFCVQQPSNIINHGMHHGRYVVSQMYPNRVDRGLKPILGRERSQVNRIPCIHCKNQLKRHVLKNQIQYKNTFVEQTSWNITTHTHTQRVNTLRIL